MKAVNCRRSFRVITPAVLVLLATGGQVAAQFPASNVTLRRHLPLSSFSPLPSAGSSCWGYVSPSGREYALMGLNNQMAVVEVTNPASAAVVGSVSHSSSSWCEVKAYSTYAYVTNETGGGLDVVNLTNVDTGVVTLAQRFVGGGLATAHTVTVNPVSGYLYLNGSNLNAGQLLALSLANPANPVIAGAWTEAGSAYAHDSQVVTYTSGPYAGREIAFCCDGGTGFDIVDVTNKSNMFRLSRSTYAHLSYCHQGWLSEDRRYFYINDETDGMNETVIFDVQNLSSPVFVGSYTAGDNATDHNLYIRSGFIYESDYRAGLRIYCAADPLRPIMVGYFDTFPADNIAGYDGSWSNFPFFPSGTVIISDINSGLFVVDASAALTAGALLFNYPSGRPALISPAGGTAVRVQVSAACGGTAAAGTGLLHYNTGGGFTSTPMQQISPNVYDAVFPAVPCGTTVRYYVSARLSSGATKFDPPNAPATTYSAASATGSTSVLSDNFETNAGWTVGDPGSPDNATTGIWTRVDPVGTAAQPEDDHTPAPGTTCFVTGQGLVGGGVGDNDVDGGKTTLMSPTLNLSGLSEPRIGYWRWYSNTAGSAPNADTFVIDISNNNGASWVNAETVGPAGPQTAGGWYYHEFRVSTLLTPTAQVKMRFVASDPPPNGSIIEAAIDDFEIFTYQCGVTCTKGDVTGDGDVDGRDIGGFTTALISGATPGSPQFCAVDMDGDNTLESGQDLNLFVACLLTSSCP